MPRMSFTDLGVRALKPPARPREARYFEKQSKGKGGVSLMLNVSYSGARSWHVLYYRDGKPSTKKLGIFPDLTVKQARDAAKGEDPKKLAAANKAGTFKTVAEAWLDDHVTRNKLRSKKEIVRVLLSYVYPEWEHKSIFEIKRADVTALLRKVEDKRIRRPKGKKRRGTMLIGSMVQADKVLAMLRSLMQWYSIENDAFTSPIIRGMKRDKRPVEERSRERVLTDDELRAVWSACDEVDIYGALLRMLLLTGQRLDKVAKLRWDDVIDGVWTIKTERREKGNATTLKLPQLALDILADPKLPRIEGNPFAFPSAYGRTHIRSFSHKKAALDELLPEITEKWTQHDLRRTARSLMARVGVSDPIAEKVLGHKLTGVLATYNRHDYVAEKADALQRLADCVALILNPPKGNVIQLKR